MKYEPQIIETLLPGLFFPAPVNQLRGSAFHQQPQRHYQNRDQRENIPHTKDPKNNRRYLSRGAGRY